MTTHSTYHDWTWDFDRNQAPPRKKRRARRPSRQHLINEQYENKATHGPRGKCARCAAYGVQTPYYHIDYMRIWPSDGRRTIAPSHPDQTMLCGLCYSDVQSGVTDCIQWGQEAGQ